jgi:hypothetical protein
LISGAAEAPATGVDWSTKTIRVKGLGAPDTKKSMNVAQARINATRAAKADAYRNAIEMLKGVQVTSGSAAGQLLDDAATRAHVEKVIKGAKEVDIKYFEDGAIEVYLEVPLNGAISEALLPEGELKKLPSTGAASFSGLVVDARRSKVAPALAPRLLDETGKEIYGASYVGREVIRSAGVAGYLKDLEAAKKNERVGEKPLVVKALKASGTSDLVLPKAETEKLRDPQANLSFLAEGKVIIVTD